MKIPGFSKADDSKLLKMRYLFVGAWNTFFALALYFLLLKIFSEENYALLLIVGFPIATAQSHFMQRRIVWKSKRNYLREFLKFMGGTISTFVINFLTLPVLVELFNLPINLSQVFLVLSLTIISYFYQKNHVFSSHPTKSRRV